MMDAPYSARARAQAEQRAASNPAVSAFVSASAGSGKTKLLTDRLLRLMLGGADPARIQCLTYTRAAAAEMALRLQSVLGGWVALPDAALDHRLRALDVEPDEDARLLARALFARVLDLPGGMRIGTIHAFCQSLLRRFPLEAAISPHFGLLEDAQARTARGDAIDAVLGDPPPDGPARPERFEARRAAIAPVAGACRLEAFDALVRALIEDRPRLSALLARPLGEIFAAQRRALCTTEDADAIMRRAIAWAGEAELRDALLAIARHPLASSGMRADALGQLDWLALPAERRATAWPEWRSHFLNKDGANCAPSTLLNKKLAELRPDLLAVLLGEQARVAEVEDAWRAAEVADLSAALLALALPVAEGYAAGKRGAIRLDYADLIDRTTALLRDPGTAWVLYKLDGGLDHLLLDEVQDTAPAQWEIAGALTDEFFAGDGARHAARTVFAVGDRKQSIFSFQGADPAAFDTWRDRLGRRVREAGQGWRDARLDVSFRSTTPVLALVDAVFADPVATPGVEVAPHYSDRAGQAGRVELWPLAPLPKKQEAPPWQVPREAIRDQSAAQLLAETLAAFIARETDGSTPLPSRGRPLAPGDVLVLLRTRTGDFGRALVRGLKQRGVPVAGLDRMILTEQPAVQDLLTLCDTLLLPDDDLSLACVLTSPLGGLDDDDMIALAPGRTGSLWAALHERAGEQPAWGKAAAFLDALFGRADYVTPHALLAEALGRLGGRARLLARLGDEAAEPIDELLAAALADAGAEPASLQGFVHRLRRSGAEVKREPETGAGGMVRIMTVHGAKGLQAPLVILPDTTGVPQEDGFLLWAEAEGGAVPLWSPNADLRCASFATLRQATLVRRAEEQDRLLYVALTRAEDRLVICGAERRGPAEDCWYQMVERGFARLATRHDPFLDWGRRLSFAVAQDGLPDRASAATVAAPAEPLPAWAGAAPSWRAAPPPPEPAHPARLAPSRPEGVAFGPVPGGGSPLRAWGGQARFRRGALLHALLQHLPDLPSADRADAARQFLARPGHALTPEDQDAALGDVLAVLAHPAMAPLFGPGSRAEVPLAGQVGGVIVGGLVDRLVVLPDRIVVADYKTARAPPARAEDAPLAHIRQMAAYRAVLRAALPGRAVDCLLVWTTGATVMPIPRGLLDCHAPDPASG